MNKILASLLIIMVSQTACSEQNNAISKSNKEVIRTEAISSKYSRLETCNGIRVVFIYKPDASQTICEISGVEDLANRVKPRVEKGTLLIATHDDRGIHYGGPSDGRPTPVVTVTGPYKLSGIESNSGSELNINKDIIMAPEVTLQVNSGGTCNIKRLLGASKITIEASSGGILTVNGITCTTITADASSGSIVTLSDTASETAINANSGAIINLTDLSTRTLSGKATSGAIINHHHKSARLEANSGAIISTK